MRRSVLALILVLGFAFPTAAEEAAELVGSVEAVYHEGVVTFTVGHPEAVSASVRVYDLESDSMIFDSGPRARTRVTWPAGHEVDGGFRYLVTAWNAEGEVVVSQTAANKRQTSISEITFDTVPDNTKFRGPDEIIMEADVQVGDTQAVRLREDYYGHGGGLYLYQEDGVLIHAYSVPEFEGTGNKTYLRGGNDDSYLLWEGYSSATNGTLSVLGVSDFIVDTGSTGDSSVVMPADAVSATEIENEAGVASSTAGVAAALAEGNNTILTASITAPTTGYVFASAFVSARFSHTEGLFSGCTCSISETPGTPYADGAAQAAIPAASPSGQFRVPIPNSRVIPVSSGMNEFFIVCIKYPSSNATYVDRRTLNLLFVPTSYGTVAISAN